MTVENSILSDQETANIRQKERSLINWFVSLKSSAKSNIQQAVEGNGDMPDRNDLLTEELKVAMSKISELSENLSEFKRFTAATLKQYDKLNYELKIIKDEKIDLKSKLYEKFNQLDKSKHTTNKLLIKHAMTMFELDRMYMKINGDKDKIVKYDTTSASHSVSKTRTRRRDYRTANNSTNTSVSNSRNRNQNELKLNIASIFKKRLAGSNNFKKKDNPIKSNKNASTKIGTKNSTKKHSIDSSQNIIIEEIPLEYESPTSGKRNYSIEETVSIRTISAKMNEGMFTDRSGIGVGLDV